MSTKNAVGSTILFVFISTRVIFADQALDDCSSPEGHPPGEIELLVSRAARERRGDCIEALLANMNFNNRGLAQLSMGLLPPADRTFALRMSLQTDAAWIEPPKAGEKIAGFRVMIERYIELFKSIGIQPTKEQLLSESGRNDLLQLLDGNQAGKIPFPVNTDDRQIRESPMPTSQPEQQSPPGTSDKKSSQILPNKGWDFLPQWLVITVAIMIASYLPWVLLKNRR